MDTKKVLYFLNVLYHETSGREEELMRLYDRAISENDDVIRLSELLNGCEFYPEVGRAMHRNGCELINRLRSDPTRSLEILPELRQASETISNAVKICEELMCSPFPFSDTITVLKRKNISAYMAALKTIAGTCVYLLALYMGIDSVRSLTWNDGVGLREMIYAVNTKFLPALMRIQIPDQSWVIRKKHMGGRALFGGDCFYLSYESTGNVEMLCGSLHKEPISTHVFLNIDAYESGACDVPYCWGVGNLVSTGPDKALMLLSNDVVTGVRSPNLGELKRRVPSPFVCVRQLSDGALFCLTPDELLSAMNQWQTGHEIETRKATHHCLFCGKHIRGGGLVCPSHFTTEF